MKIIIAILTTVLLLGFNYSYAEGDPDGCKWTVIEETDQYIMAVSYTHLRAHET